MTMATLRFRPVCLICLDKLEQNYDKEIPDWDPLILARFLKFISRYLKLESSAEKFLSEAHKFEKNGKLLKIFCDNCVQLVTYVCDLYSELESVKLKLLWRLEELGNVMKDSRRSDLSGSLELDGNGPVSSDEHETILNGKLFRDFRRKLEFKCISTVEYERGPKVFIPLDKGAEGSVSSLSNVKETMARLIVIYILASFGEGNPNPTNAFNYGNAPRMIPLTSLDKVVQRKRRITNASNENGLYPEVQKIKLEPPEAVPIKFENTATKSHLTGTTKNEVVESSITEEFHTTVVKCDGNYGETEWDDGMVTVEDDPVSNNDSVVRQEVSNCNATDVAEVEVASSDIDEMSAATNSINSGSNHDNLVHGPQFTNAQTYPVHTSVATTWSTNNTPLKLILKVVDNPQSVSQAHQRTFLVRRKPQGDNEPVLVNGSMPGTYPLNSVALSSPGYSKLAPATVTSAQQKQTLQPTSLQISAPLKNFVPRLLSHPTNATRNIAPAIRQQQSPAQPRNLNGTREGHTIKAANPQGRVAPILVKCPKCPETYSSVRSLTAHLKSSHHTVLLFKCSFCNREFDTRQKRKQHEWTHHLEPITECIAPNHKFHCDKDVCLAGFASISDLNNHLETHLRKNRNVEKGEPTPRTEGLTTFKCSICDMGFLKHYNLELHQVTHWATRDKNERALFCPVCELRCNDAEGIIMHYNLKHGENRPLYTCPKCKLECRDTLKLFKAHVLSHKFYPDVVDITEQEDGKPKPSLEKNTNAKQST